MTHTNITHTHTHSAGQSRRDVTLSFAYDLHNNGSRFLLHARPTDETGSQDETVTSFCGGGDDDDDDDDDEGGGDDVMLPVTSSLLGEIQEALGASG